MQSRGDHRRARGARLLALERRAPAQSSAEARIVRKARERAAPPPSRTSRRVDPDRRVAIARGEAEALEDRAHQCREADATLTGR